jgi:hypothetical protein
MRGYLPAGPAELQSSLVSIVPYLRPPFTLEKSKLLSIMLVDNLFQRAHMIGIPHEGRYAIPELDQQVKADGHSGGWGMFIPSGDFCVASRLHDLRLVIVLVVSNQYNTPASL